MRKKLIGRLGAAVTAFSVGLGMSPVVDAAASTATYSASTLEATSLDSATETDAKGSHSSVSALAGKLGLKEQTVADALISVQEQVQATSAFSPSNAASTRLNGRGAKQVEVARALAAELRLDVSTVSTSLAELQVAARNTRLLA